MDERLRQRILDVLKRIEDRLEHDNHVEYGNGPRGECDLCRVIALRADLTRHTTRSESRSRVDSGKGASR